DRGAPRLRPGTELLTVSADKLHLTLSNHTVTFTTPPVTRAVRALVDAMDDGARRSMAEVVDRAAAEVGLDVALVRYVFEMLEGSNCLYWTDAQEPEPEGSVWDYFASIGDRPSAVRRALARSRPLVVTAEPGAAAFVGALTSAGIESEVLTLAA